MAELAQGSNEFIDTIMPHSAISWDEGAFDAMIRSQGVLLEHWSAMRCPVGMVDIDDNRRPGHDHAGCSNGFLYQRMGYITAWFSGNSKQQKLEDYGYTNGASAFCTFPRNYDQTEPCCGGDKTFYLAPFDRFFLAEKKLIVPTWQTLVSSGTGFERTAFPIVKVIRLVDWRNVEYFAQQDFVITAAGQLQWTGQKRPTPDVGGSGKAVFAIRYLYRPFWYTARLQHEIRVSQSDQEGDDSNRELIRNPQQAILNREYLYLNEQNQGPEFLSADQARAASCAVPATPANSTRQDQAPDQPGFGPR